MDRRLFLFRHLSRPLIPPMPSTPHLYCHIKRYTQYTTGDPAQGIEERAPSLADEFRRVAEEKAKADQETTHVADQGVASHTVKKTFDGGEEASTGDGDTQSVKDRYKEHEQGADYRRKE
ncbi:uncharacterized protein LOC110610611 [Manihot esculenta]|uniref:Uncharacterized protein n=1 Tax=Manihot esculenta TaxID=3983 RepID=A0A2C9W8M4_MANES|nr:uncharacterized protein LOC110610611 [Manihot esculenta]